MQPAYLAQLWVLGPSEGQLFFNPDSCTRKPFSKTRHLYSSIKLAVSLYFLHVEINVKTLLTTAKYLLQTGTTKARQVV